MNKGVALPSVVASTGIKSQLPPFTNHTPSKPTLHNSSIGQLKSSSCSTAAIPSDKNNNNSERKDVDHGYDVLPPSKSTTVKVKATLVPSQAISKRKPVVTEDLSMFSADTRKKMKSSHDA